MTFLNICYQIIEPAVVTIEDLKRGRLLNLKKLTSSVGQFSRHCDRINEAEARQAETNCSRPMQKIKPRPAGQKTMCSQQQFHYYFSRAYKLCLQLKSNISICLTLLLHLRLFVLIYYKVKINISYIVKSHMYSVIISILAQKGVDRVRCIQRCSVCWLTLLRTNQSSIDSPNKTGINRNAHCCRWPEQPQFINIFKWTTHVTDLKNFMTSNQCWSQFNSDVSEGLIMCFSS